MSKHANTDPNRSGSDVHSSSSRKRDEKSLVKKRSQFSRNESFHSREKTLMAEQQQYHQQMQLIEMAAIEQGHSDLPVLSSASYHPTLPVIPSYKPIFEQPEKVKATRADSLAAARKQL
jgi:hypothetical protein